MTGPSGEVPFDSLADQGKRVGIDTMLARLQVVGTFRAEETGEHELTCDGLGVVVAPQIGAASAIARLGGLVLGSLGTFLGLTMVLIGGVLLLFMRGGDGEDDLDDTADPPPEGADEWWEDEAAPEADARPGQDDDARFVDQDDYIEVSEEELAAMSEEQIQELVGSGALIFVDDDESMVHGDPGGPGDPGETYR